MSSRIFGSGIRRREDPRLITGSATYTGDIRLPGMVHAAMLRSSHAHARITRIDTSAAAAAPGVIAVYTGTDTEGALQPMPCAWLLPDSGLRVAPYPCIAKDVVRYTGDIVAVVVAERLYQAHDAVDLIEVDYEPLPAVTDPEQAAARRTRRSSTPRTSTGDDIEGNQAFHWTVAGGDVDAAFAAAEADGVVIKERILQQRLIPNAMETRGGGGPVQPGERRAHALEHDPEPAHRPLPVLGRHRRAGGQAARHRARGGGRLREQDRGLPRGLRHGLLLEDAGAPGQVDRDPAARNYQATTHGRDHVQDVELAATKDGRITGLRCTVRAGMGAYLSTRRPPAFRPSCTG